MKQMIVKYKTLDFLPASIETMVKYGKKKDSDNFHYGAI